MFSSETAKWSYQGNGATLNFSVTQLFYANSDLLVYLLEIATGILTLKTITTHYTVTGAGVDGGGTVTFLSAPAATHYVVILRIAPATQPDELTNGTELDVENVIEVRLDKLAMVGAQLTEKMARAPLLPVLTAYGNTPTLIDPDPGQVMRLNEAGDAFEWVSVFDAGGIVLDLDAAADQIVRVNSLGSGLEGTGVEIGQVLLTANLLAAILAVDGAGSGIDADLLDGQSSAYYLSASNLNAGTLPAARFDDTAHGSRAGGALHPAAIAAGVSGFMTGADKTKLDGVQAGATDDQTAAEILAALLTVDGAASLLDADLLDAQDGAYYLALGNATGTLAVAKGGTGLASYAVGDLIYADGATSLAKLADIATGNALLSGGVGVAPVWGKVGLTTHISGTLAVANGGTGSTAMTASRAVITDSSGNIVTSANVTPTELSYLNGVTSAIQTQLNTKAPLASPALTGTPTAPTAAPGTNTTQIATTAFVEAATSGAFAPLASPTFTGDPKAPTPTTGDNDTSIATTAYVHNTFANPPDYGSLTDLGNVYTDILAVGGQAPASPAANRLYGNGGKLVLISAQTASNSAAITFTGGFDGRFKGFLFVFNGVYPSSSGADLGWRVSLDGSTWKSGASDYQYELWGFNNGGASGAAGGALSYVLIANSNSAASNLPCDGQLWIPDPTNAGQHKHGRSQATGVTAAPANTSYVAGGHYNTGTEALLGIAFVMSTGNIAFGKFYQYGILGV